MPRLLSVNFNYAEHIYVALVTIDNMEDELDFNIRIPDESLHSLIPEGKMSYSSRKGFYPVRNTTTYETQELLGSVVREVEKRLYS